MLQLQEYCAKKPSALCDDGGADWAVAPVGTAANTAATKWAPMVETVVAGSSKRAGEKYGCAARPN